MDFTLDRIREIYTGRVVDKNDSFMGQFFKNFKKKAFSVSSLRSGDQVLVFCCRSGLDFPYILKKIEKNGNIIGVDFSEDMQLATGVEALLNPLGIYLAKRFGGSYLGHQNRLDLISVIENDLKGLKKT